MKTTIIKKIMKTKITLFLTCIFCLASVSAQTVGTVTDYDGNVYKTVKIGNQWWMAENLRATHYYDGTAIPQSPVTKTVSADDYKDYFLYPNNDAANVATYGLLYSWSVTTTKTLLPTGWVLPDTTAWAELSAYLGGRAIAGGKLKSTSSVWTSPNTSATDDYGFNAVPAGDCNTGGFTVFGTQARYWTPQLVDVGGAGRIYIFLANTSAAVTKGQYRNVNAISLRYVKSITSDVASVNSEEKPVLQSSVVGGSLILNNVQTSSRLAIYSISGTMVRSTVATLGTKFEWDLSGLSKGIYVLSVQNETGSEKLKFIKE